MGMEICVENLEDMCSLMCDNKVPRRIARYKGKGNKAKTIQELQEETNNLKAHIDLLEMKISAVENNLYFKLSEEHKKQVDELIFKLVLEQYN